MTKSNQERTRAVKRKCDKLKLEIFDEEFISLKQMEQYAAAQLKAQPSAIPRPQKDWAQGSSFEGLGR